MKAIIWNIVGLMLFWLVDVSADAMAVPTFEEKDNAWVRVRTV